MEKVREAAFNILEHNSEMPRIQESNLLDLFAGSGSFGFEAISRGIHHCTFVDKCPACLDLIRKTAAKLSVENFITTHRVNLTKVSSNPFGRRYNIVFCGAPYEKHMLIELLKSLGERGWIENNCLCIIEDRKKEDVVGSLGMRILKESRYGKTYLTFISFTSGK